LGALIRRHRRFAPRGVNANFVQVLAPGRIALRTFEFGVEQETLACGTGSAAAAILSAIRFRWPKKHLSAEEPVLVQARSGEVLKVHFNLRDGGTVDELCLDTVVRCVYTGTLCPQLAEEVLKSKGSAPSPRRA
jgi:diaminopimelate epimerase